MKEFLKIILGYQLIVMPYMLILIVLSDSIGFYGVLYGIGLISLIALFIGLGIELLLN